MKTKSDLIIIYKKNKNNKIKNINLIILYSILFSFIYICLLIILSLNRTIYKSVNNNIDENFIITYSRFNRAYINSGTYQKLLNEIEKVEVVSIYSTVENSSELLYDFKYLNFDKIINYSQGDSVVCLSYDYKDNYSLGDEFNVFYGKAKIIGFVESDESNIYLNLNYVIKNIDNCVQRIYFELDSSNLNKSKLDKILTTYKVMNKLIDVNDYCSNYDLDVFIKTFDKIKIFIIIGIIITILVSIIFISTIYNAFIINIEEDTRFYSMLRVCGLGKKDIYKIIFFENLLIIFSSYVISICLFFAIYSSLKKFFQNFIELFLKVMVDDFSYKLYISFVPSFYIFLIPLLIFIIIILLNLILKRNKFSFLNENYLKELCKDDE